jgi:hypothetical protein
MEIEHSPFITFWGRMGRNRFERRDFGLRSYQPRYSFSVRGHQLKGFASRLFSLPIYERLSNASPLVHGVFTNSP